MSDIAQTLAVTQADATRQVMQTQMLRQQAQADQAVATMIQQSADQMQATLPAGQGQILDRTA
ncbi:hypothetical protein [Bosea sp. AAP35]|uniref:hypothetical protein n=1 Tax=Bosea sp. AAP35 TaxID=1523417 RepID=UPI0006B8B4B7|nr:hypothetical protein [Bosea sp. AAP35]